MKREEAKQLSDQALAALQEELKAGRSQSLQRYLDAMSRFHSYSWNNCLLIAIQMPDSTHVAGFRRWSKMGRHVRKGEKGIGIMAPLVYRKRDDNHRSSATGDDKTDRSIHGFKIVHVFDISQTEGDDLPELASINGDPGELIHSLEELIRSSGISLKNEVFTNGAKGVSRQGEIAIAEDLPLAERFAILAHELSHLCCDLSYVAGRTFRASSPQ